MVSEFYIYLFSLYMQFLGLSNAALNSFTPIFFVLQVF